MEPRHRLEPHGSEKCTMTDVPAIACHCLQPRQGAHALEAATGRGRALPHAQWPRGKIRAAWGFGDDPGYGLADMLQAIGPIVLDQDILRSEAGIHPRRE